MMIISGKTSSGKEVMVNSIVDHLPLEDNSLLVITGRAASGKDTLARRLLNHGRTMVITHTTRPRRPGEGHAHHFIDVGDMDNYLNKILGTKVNGNYYFALEEDLYKHDILIVDANGVFDILNLPTINRKYRIIYLDVDEEIRKSRYIKRANTNEADFISRNRSENQQFDTFEAHLQSKDYRDKHHISVIRNDDELEALIEELAGLPLEL